MQVERVRIRSSARETISLLMTTFFTPPKKGPLLFVSHKAQAIGILCYAGLIGPQNLTGIHPCVIHDIHPGMLYQ